MQEGPGPPAGPQLDPPSRTEDLDAETLAGAPIAVVVIGALIVLSIKAAFLWSLAYGVTLVLAVVLPERIEPLYVVEGTPATDVGSVSPALVVGDIVVVQVIVSGSRNKESAIGYYSADDVPVHAALARRNLAARHAKFKFAVFRSAHALPHAFTLSLPCSKNALIRALASGADCATDASSASVKKP